MAGEDDRFEWFPIGGVTVGDDSDGLDGRGVQTHEVVQQPVLVDRQVLDDLLCGIDVVANGDESHHVAGDASG